MSRIARFAAAVGCVLAMLLTLPVRADDAAVRREAQFKAAYLFNFVKFVEWPATAGVAADPISVCFVGGDSVLAALSMGIEDKRVGARHLVARRIASSATPDICDVLYLDAASATDLQQVLGSNDLPILTVSDGKSFTDKGGMIELFTETNRLRFNINVDASQKAGLRISSSLLQLAAAVTRGGA